MYLGTIFACTLEQIKITQKYIFKHFNLTKSGKGGRKCAKTRILTKSPELEIIRNAKKEKLSKPNKISKKPKFTANKNKKRLSNKGSVNIKLENDPKPLRTNAPRVSRKVIDFKVDDDSESDFSANSGECYDPKTDK